MLIRHDWDVTLQTLERAWVEVSLQRKKQATKQDEFDHPFGPTATAGRNLPLAARAVSHAAPRMNMVYLESSSRPGRSIHTTDFSRVNSLPAVKDSAWLWVKRRPGESVAYLPAVSPLKKIMA